MVVARNGFVGNGANGCGRGGRIASAKNENNNCNVVRAQLKSARRSAI
jgi:hypothetical protein